MFNIKTINIDSGDELKVLINQDLADKLRLHSQEKVIIQSLDKSRKIICILAVDTKNSLKKNTIGVYKKAAELLDAKDFTRGVDIFSAPKPKSLEYVRLKFENKIRLEHRHFMEILEDILNRSYGKIETTYFVLACSAHPLNDAETIALTQAMVDCGKHLDFQSKERPIIVDKHCIGGVPNNRTTMLAIPLVMAAGLTIPKTSSRAITSPSGTADTMEVLCNVDLDLDELFSQVNEIGGSIAWGGSLDLSPADDIIIKVEHPLHIDTEGQMIASILSKKKSAGSTHVLIDIPYGKHTKVETLQKAKHLEKRFKIVGQAIGLEIAVTLTPGSEPIGNGIGPYFEALDVLAVLANSKYAPQDLRKKAMYVTGQLFEFAKVVKKGEGEKHAQAIIESGLGYEMFEKIRKAQGYKELPEFPKYGDDIVAKHDGKVKAINNVYISKLAYALGCPQTKTAGIIIKKKVGDTVQKGDVLFEIYAESETKLNYALRYMDEHFPYIY